VWMLYGIASINADVSGLEIGKLHETGQKQTSRFLSTAAIRCNITHLHWLRTLTISMWSASNVCLREAMGAFGPIAASCTKPV
jgi:hypothetical protein